MQGRHHHIMSGLPEGTREEIRVMHLTPSIFIFAGLVMGLLIEFFTTVADCANYGMQCDVESITMERLVIYAAFMTVWIAFQMTVLKKYEVVRA